MTSALDPTAPPALVRAPVLVAGEELDVAEWLPVVNPVRTSEVAGEVALGGAGHVDRTVQAAHRGLPAWAALHPRARADRMAAAAPSGPVAVRWARPA